MNKQNTRSIRQKTLKFIQQVSSGNRIQPRKSQSDNQFLAFRNERSSMGKLLNEEFLNSQEQNMREIQYRKNLAHNSYVPPTYKTNMSARKMKVLVGEKLKNYKQNDEIEIRSKQFSLSDDQSGGDKLNYLQDSIVEDYNKVELNLVKQQKSKTEVSPTINRIDSEYLISSTENITSSHSKQTSFTLRNNRKIQALLQKQLLEDKAIEAILQKKRLLTDNSNIKSLQSLISERQNTKNQTQISTSPNYDESQQYMDSEEYMVRYFNMNLNVQQRADNFLRLEAVKKLKLPHIHLLNQSKQLSSIPPLGFYNPNYQQIYQKTAKNIFFGKSASCYVIKQMSSSPIRRSLISDNMKPKQSKFDVMKQLVNDIFEENKKIKQEFSKQK